MVKSEESREGSSKRAPGDVSRMRVSHGERAKKTFSSNDASMDANCRRNEIRDHVGY